MTPPEPRVEVHASLEELSGATAGAIVQAARESVDARGSFSLVLSGGETPRRTYELLAGRHAAEIAWDRTHVFFSDERFVPPDDARSNFAMASGALLSRVPIPAENVHAIRTIEGTPAEVASRYEVELAESREEPTFDCALMGVGADGHTASLFPGDAAVKESRGWVLAVQAPASAPVRQRITLTLPVLNRSRRVLFLVAGKGKAAVVARVLRRDDANEEPLPAALVHGVQETRWLLDAEAAADVGR